MTYDFANAPIRSEAYMRGPQETGISVLAIDTPQGPVLFEIHIKYAQNGNDFWVVVANFGMFSKYEAGGKRPPMKKFSSEEIGTARQRLQEYFSGSEEKIVHPFDRKDTQGNPKGKLLAIQFPDGWAAEA